MSGAGRFFLYKINIYFGESRPSSKEKTFLQNIHTQIKWMGQLKKIFVREDNCYIFVELTPHMDWICWTIPGPICCILTCIPLPRHMSHFLKHPGFPPRPRINICSLFANIFLKYFGHLAQNQFHCRWINFLFFLNFIGWLKKIGLVF